MILKYEGEVKYDVSSLLDKSLTIQLIRQLQNIANINFEELLQFLKINEFREQRFNTMHVNATIWGKYYILRYCVNLHTWRWYTFQSARIQNCFCKTHYTLRIYANNCGEKIQFSTRHVRFFPLYYYLDGYTKVVLTVLQYTCAHINYSR